MLLRLGPNAYRKPHPRPKRQTTATPTPALMLVAAEYVEATYVDLTFDRAADIAGIVVGAFTVNDGVLGFGYVGDSAELLGPTVVRVQLVGLIEEPFVGIHLNALPINGIVASDDAAAWAGCENVELPFP